MAILREDLIQECNDLAFEITAGRDLPEPVTAELANAKDIFVQKTDLMPVFGDVDANVITPCCTNLSIKVAGEVIHESLREFYLVGDTGL